MISDIVEYLSCSSKVEEKGGVEHLYFGPSRNEDTLPSNRTLKALGNKISVKVLLLPFHDKAERLLPKTVPPTDIPLKI